jgi:tetratricopeptide (TPR) repeat protein
LDGFPLALATAGAYLDQTSMSFASYLRLYRASWLKLQQTSPELSSYEDRTLYSTWQLSFGNIQQQNGLSAKLLQWWAYFDNQDLWFELLHNDDQGRPEWLCRLAEDEVSFHQAMRTLCEHGMAEIDQSSGKTGSESKGYSIHACVHSWTIHVLNRERDLTMARSALLCVAFHIPHWTERDYWITQTRILRHATRCPHLMDEIEFHMVDRGFALGRLGLLYMDQEKPAAAEEVFSEGLKAYQKALGPDHISTLHAFLNLGTVYVHQRRLADAERMYQKAVQGFVKTLGPTHVETLDAVAKLGILYSYQAKLADSEQHLQRALEGYKKIARPRHLSTLNAICGLGVLYARQGKLAQAEEMFQDALPGYIELFGPGHVLPLTTLNNFGKLYLLQGKTEKAEEAFRQALAGYEKVVGADRVTNYLPALGIMENFGVLYARLGRMDDTEEMYARALRGYEAALGRSHAKCQDLIEILSRLKDDQLQAGSTGGEEG